MDFFEEIPLSSRGIRVEECPWGILIESSITYVPTNLNITGYLPISCYIQKKFVFIFVQKGIKNKSSTLGATAQEPVGQKKSTSPQMENVGTHPQVSFGAGINL